jgi:hypothetical protein
MAGVRLLRRACASVCVTCAAPPPPPPARRRAASTRSHAPPSGWEAGASAGFALPAVHLTYKAAEAEALLARHVGEGLDGASVVLGMDTESRPQGFGGDGRVALLQLATPRAVVLLPLLRLQPAPPALARLLALPRTLLCGVGVAADADAFACAAATVDVGVAAARHAFVEVTPQRPTPGLATVVEALGGPLLQKPRRITLSNWEDAPLSAAQVSYAALDAYAGGWAAAQMHALLGAQAAAAGAPPLPPLAAWLAAEAALQVGERAAARARAAAVQAALVAALAPHARGMSTRALTAAVMARLPAERTSYVSNAIVKQLKRGTLLRVPPLTSDAGGRWVALAPASLPAERT